jgi:NTE family protein
LGRLEGWLYRVAEEDPGTINELFFAASLPGAPVQMTTYESGNPVSSLEQVERSRPAGAVNAMPTSSRTSVLPSKPLRLLASVLICWCLASTLAAETPGPEDDKLVLVLSGGGARGAAHIGVLRVLEELHIAPDLIVGTSMGSIIGGLYAAGWSPDDIETLVQMIDWERVFTDRVERRDLSFRRKQDDHPVMIRGRLHFEGLNLELPSGVIAGQRLEIILRLVEALSPTREDFDELPIAYRAVAADIATGEAVVIGSGSLATAMRASMSVPGAVPPVALDGRDLVDGGIAANLPVEIAQRLGATRVIAVDISSPLLEEGQEFGTFMSVFSHLNSLLTVGNRDRDIRRLGAQDLLIVPELGDISFVSFDRLQEAVAIGEEAARLEIDALRRYEAASDRWAAFEARPRAEPFTDLSIDRLRLDNASRVDDRLVERALRLEPPATLDAESLGRDLLELYNTRYFGVLGFELEETPDGAHELVVHAPPPPHGRGSLQLGFGFLDDFDGGAGYHLQARHQMLPVNRRGGEWQTLFQIGTVAGVRTELYQPLDWSMRWFAEPALEYEKGTQELWGDGEAIAEYQFTHYRAQLAAGRVLGRWGELRLTAFTSKNRGAPRIGDPAFTSDSETLGGGEFRFRVDTEDSVVFPRSGADVSLLYTRSSDSLGSDYGFERWSGSASYAWSIGENTLVPGLEYGENIDDVESFFALYDLGGLFRLSGLGTKELLGDRMALARIVGYRRLFRLEVAGISVRLYAGASIEAGNAFLFEDTSLSWGNMMKAGSVFVGADTFLGPAILAYGVAEGGRKRVYLAIGDRF